MTKQFFSGPTLWQPKTKTKYPFSGGNIFFFFLWFGSKLLTVITHRLRDKLTVEWQPCAFFMCGRRLFLAGIY